MISALSNQIKSCEYKSRKLLLVALTTGTPIQASATSLQFIRAQFYGYKSLSNTAGPTNNTSSAQLGYLDASNIVGGGANKPAFTDTITAGSSLTIADAKPGVKYDLADIWLAGATNDSIVIVYEQ